MSEKKILAALHAVVAAMAPLDPESRRRVIEATHTLLEIGPGRRGQDRPAKGKSRRR